MPNFAVIIPSRNGDNLYACIRSVGKRERVRYHVIDDGITPGHHALSCITGNFIAGEKPFIYARNVNLGIREALEENPALDGVILLNDDAQLLTPGGFTALANFAAGHPEYGLIAPRVHSPICAETDASRPVNESGVRDEPRMVAFACVYIPRRTIETVGLLDERYVGYGCDDDDYCLRVRNAGLKIGVLPSVEVDHSELPSTFRPGNGPGEFSANEALFREKWGHGLYGPNVLEWRPADVRLFIATPCYGGYAHAAYMASLLATTEALRDAGVSYTVKLCPGDSLVPRARGVLTAQFMASDYTHLLFIDGDIWWKPDDVFRLIAATSCPDVRVACGIYPRKQIPAHFPVNFALAEGGILTRHEKTGYFEVVDAPTGFLMIRREVIEQLIAAHPERKCRFREVAPENEQRYEYDLFPTPIVDGWYKSEDFGFSRLWQAQGGRIWADPYIDLTHYGQHRYEGSIREMIGGSR